MKFDFNLPEENGEIDIINKRKIRTFLSKNTDRCRLLLHLYKIQPCSLREISEKSKVDGRNVYHWFRFLRDMDVITHYNGKDVLISSNHSPITDIIREKYLQATDGYFFNKKRDVNYFVITKSGEEQIPYCCELLNVSFKEK